MRRKTGQDRVVRARLRGSAPAREQPLQEPANALRGCRRTGLRIVPTRHDRSIVAAVAASRRAAGTTRASGLARNLFRRLCERKPGGSIALTVVGPPGALSISSRPPSSRSRSRMPTRPMLLSVLGRHHVGGIEAATVVTDLHADALEALVAQNHGDLAAAAVVPDVAQRLLQDAGARSSGRR